MTAVLVSLAILLGGALLCALLTKFPRAALLVATLSIVTASIFALSAAIPALVLRQDVAPMTLSWPMPLGRVQLALDGLSAWFLATIAVLSNAVAIYTWAYMQEECDREPVAVLGAFLCALVGALILVVTAGDVVSFLVGWESMMLASFFLVAFHHRQAEVRRAAWIYLIANHLGTALFVVPLFGVLAATAGGLDFFAFRPALQQSDPATGAALFVLGLLGFGTKAGFMPMHVWLPVAHPAAPSPVSALLSGVVIKVGIYGLLRLLGWLPPLPTGCAVLMLVFAAVSGVVGVLYALAQHDIKRLLAYHSVENIGIIGLGMGMGMLGQTLRLPPLTALGYGGALLHVLNHALFKGLLFLSAGTVIHATGTGDIERLGGLARRTPVNAGLFLLAAISICGLPPFNGFVSEWLLYGSMFSGGWSSSRAAAGVSAMGVVSLALMGGLALACFSKVYGVVFLGEPRDRSVQPHSTPALMVLGMFIPAALCVAIGVAPGVFVPLTARGVHAMSNINATEFVGATQSVLSPIGQLSLLAIVLLALVFLLGLARRLLLRRRGEPSYVPTWGCGYTQPYERMQYTASSFVSSLVQSFRGLLWTHRTLVAPAVPFAGHAELESHTPDLAEHDLFAPLLRGVSRAFGMVRHVSWTGQPTPPSQAPIPDSRARPIRLLFTGVVAALRQGRIHVYMVFIVLTLLVVFLVESLSQGSSGLSAAVPASLVDGGSK